MLYFRMLSSAAILSAAAIVLAVWAPDPANAGAAAASTALPATLSPLDPIRLAADFAPASPALPPVAAFDEALIPPPVAPAADSLPPVMRRLQDEFAFEEDRKPKGSGGPPSVAAPIAGALVGGTLGLFGGAILGNEIDDGSGTGEWDDLTGAAAGALIGEVFLMPAGAHVANGSRGSYGSALVGSILGFVATLMLGTLGPGGAIVGLGVQTALTVSGERRSAERKAASREEGTAMHEGSPELPN